MDLMSGFEHCMRENEPLAAHTWFRLGGAAQYFAEPTNIEELTALVQRCRQNEVPVRLLGGGSNVLVSSQGVSGVVISISAPAFGDIQVRENSVAAGGGARLAHVISSTVRDGLAGMEPLVGIPGTVGGALYGNSGSHGTDVGQWCREATVMTRSGEVITRGPEDLRFAYRKSSLDELVILRARFDLESDDPVELTRRMQKMWIIKRANEPSSEIGSGYIFKDPQGMSAAELIEQAGLKGTRVGAAEVSDRNANFIVADAGATSDDVRRLIDLIRNRISSNWGIQLEEQIEFW
jgi:UDP-N-acetylmuramate dehydrogenase